MSLLMSMDWRSYAMALAAFSAGCVGEAQDAGSYAPLDAGSHSDGGSSWADPDAGRTRAPFVCGAVATGLSEGRQGAVDDVVTAPQRVLAVMGGSVEVDAAARVFAEGAAGGDLLVLRASGSVNSYTPWFHEELAIAPALSSTTTIRIDDPAAADSDYVLCRIEAAEALWLAGGDQWDYLGRWSEPLHRLIGTSSERGGAIGGTSAGAMILGEGAFDAAEGSVSSEQALEDPLASFVSIQTPMTAQPELAGMMIDTHFTARQREGRLIAFLAVFKDQTAREEVIGIGLDERAALVIRDGEGEVYAGAPGRHVTLYRLAGDQLLSSDAPLELSLVKRWVLSHGDTLSWPPDFSEAAAVDHLVVQAGLVSQEAD